MVFTNDRKLNICKQIHMKEIFMKFNDGELMLQDKVATDKKQVLAVALSISNKQCKDLRPINKKYMSKFKPKHLLKMLKTKELKALVKTDKRINPKDVDVMEDKQEIYDKYLNKNKFFNKVIYYLSDKN